MPAISKSYIKNNIPRNPINSVIHSNVDSITQSHTNKVKYQQQQKSSQLLPSGALVEALRANLRAVIGKETDKKLSNKGSTTIQRGIIYENITKINKMTNNYTTD